MKRLLLILLLLSSCQQASEIKMGSILILTGDGSSWGIATRNGIDMAVDEINAQGGVLGKKVRVIHENDEFNPGKAISAFRKLTEIDGVNTIIGTTWSHTGLPLIPLAHEKKVVMISPSLGKRDFNEGSPYLFNLWPHDYLLSKELARLVFSKGHRNVAIFGAEEVWTKEQTDSFKRVFEELSGKVSLVLEPNPDNKDLRTEALRIATSKGLDAIIITYVWVADIIGKRLQAVGVSLPHYGVTVDNAPIKAAQGALDRMIFLTSLTPSKEFEEKYKQRYGTDLDIGADTGYDAIMLLAQAIQATGSTDSDKIQEYLNSLETYEGVSGHLTFDGKGGVTKPFVVKEIREGKTITIEP